MPALADPADAADLATYLRRLRRYEPGLAVRLRAQGGVLGVFARPPFGVVTLRAVTLRDATPLDVTVPGPALEEALAEAAVSGQLDLPEPLPPSAWPSALPPAAGWRRLGAADAGAVSALVTQAVAEFRRSVAPVAAGPGDRGAEAGEAVAEQLWSRPLRAPLGDVPLRAAHAAAALGFLGEGEVVGYAHQAWARLECPYGSVAVRRRAALPLQPVEGS